MSGEIIDVTGALSSDQFYRGDISLVIIVLVIVLSLYFKSR
jgi:hypothetical protein